MNALKEVEVRIWNKPDDATIQYRLHYMTWMDDMTELC